MVLRLFGEDKIDESVGGIQRRLRDATPDNLFFALTGARQFITAAPVVEVGDHYQQGSIEKLRIKFDGITQGKLYRHRQCLLYGFQGSSGNCRQIILPIENVSANDTSAPQ